MRDNSFLALSNSYSGIRRGYIVSIVLRIGNDHVIPTGNLFQRHSNAGRGRQMISRQML